MKTEKDIRSFMLENRPVLHDSGKFMSDLIRQIDLLPACSAFGGTAYEQRKKEEKDIILNVFMSLQKRRILKTAAIMLLAVMAASAAAVTVWLMPDSLFAGFGWQSNVPATAFRCLLTVAISSGAAAAAGKSVLYV